MDFVANTTNAVLLSMLYDLEDEWVEIYDNELLAWGLDAAGAAPAVPIIVGSLPAPATPAQASSPQWAVVTAEQVVFVPDIWRGPFPAFLDWLARDDDGALPRKLSAMLASPGLINQWEAWARLHPHLIGSDEMTEGVRGLRWGGLAAQGPR